MGFTIFPQDDILLACYFYRISILAFHEALVHQPRDPLVVATFALALYLGVDMLLAVDIGKSFNCQHDAGFSELLEPQVGDDKHLVTEVQGLVASVRLALSEMTDEYYVAKCYGKNSSSTILRSCIYPTTSIPEGSQISCVFNMERRSIATN